MNTPPHFDVYLAPAACKSRVWLDGRELRNLRAVAVTARAGEATQVTLEFYGVEVNYADRDGAAIGNGRPIRVRDDDTPG